MIREPFEIKIRRLMDEACELLPKLSGAQLEVAYQHHKFLSEAALAELVKRKAQ